MTAHNGPVIDIRGQYDGGDNEIVHYMHEKLCRCLASRMLGKSSYAKHLPDIILFLRVEGPHSNWPWFRPGLSHRYRRQNPSYISIDVGVPKNISLSGDYETITLWLSEHVYSGVTSCIEKLTKEGIKLDAHALLNDLRSALQLFGDDDERPLSTLTPEQRARLETVVRRRLPDHQKRLWEEGALLGVADEILLHEILTDEWFDCIFELHDRKAAEDALKLREKVCPWRPERTGVQRTAGGSRDLPRGNS